MLPIIKTPSSDLYRLFLQAKHQLVLALGEQHELDVGTIIINPGFQEIPDANHVRDARVPAGKTAAQVIEDVQRFFTQRNSRCCCYVTQDPPLIDELTKSGWCEDVMEVQILREYQPLSLALPESIKIIPARASFRHTAEILEPGRLAHLDDPRFELLLALRDGRSIARGGLFTMGEVGLITHMKVIESARRQGVGGMLMAHLLDLCARSQLKHIMLDLRPDNLAAKRLYERLGFRKLCDHVTYRAPV